LHIRLRDSILFYYLSAMTGLAGLLFKNTFIAPAKNNIDVYLAVGSTLLVANAILLLGISLIYLHHNVTIGKDSLFIKEVLKKKCELKNNLDSYLSKKQHGTPNVCSCCTRCKWIGKFVIIIGPQIVILLAMTSDALLLLHANTKYVCKMSNSFCVILFISSLLYLFSFVTSIFILHKSDSYHKTKKN